MLLNPRDSLPPLSPCGNSAALRCLLQEPCRREGFVMLSSLCYGKKTFFPRFKPLLNITASTILYHSPASTQVPLSFHHPASPAREHWEGPPQWAPSSFLPWQCGQGPLGAGGLDNLSLFLRQGSAVSPGSDLPKPRNTSLRPDKKENVCD